MKLSINQLCRATGFSHEQLLERNRQGNRPLARYLVARELHKRGVTRAEIGRLLGIDQSTATYGILTVIPNVIKTKTPLNGYYMIAEYRKTLEQIAQGEDFCPFVYESNIEIS